MKPSWEGRTVVCIASGPSLTAEDCELARASGHPVVVTNTTFQLCPWADALYAHDTAWWRRYQHEIQGFSGRKFAATQIATRLGAETTFGANWFKQFSNSGACAISLAMSGGAAKIVLIGFDACAGLDGEMHWHGDHPRELNNAQSIGNWPRQFKIIAKDAEKNGIDIVNASKRTALTCFRRGDLVAEL